MMKHLRKLWQLPKPTSLGFSSDCAMGMRDFGLQPGQECWEDYYELCEEKYPVRYFMDKRMGTAVRRFRGHVRDLKYEILYLFSPRHRYHKLSLSQPSGYKRGWCDSDRQILFANFNILVNFVEGEAGGISRLEDDLERYLDRWGEYNGVWIDHAKRTQELIDLYSYWKWERLPYYQYDLYENPYESFEQSEADFEKETEMLARLMKVRRSMWT